jgi:very-short-patch-repair endonuclease
MLWGVVRANRFGGYKFKRQESIGQYLVDFVCYAAKLVVEVDGQVHDGRADEDAERTEELQKRGFRVIRFTADEVRNNLEGVAIAIELACQN